MFTPNIPGQVSPPAGFTALPGLTPPSVGTLGGGVAQQNIITTLFDRNPFAILRDIHERHINVSDFRILLKAMGMTRGVDAPTTGHYEHGWDLGMVKIGAVTTASTGAGTNVVLTLHADSMFNAGAQVGGAARQASEVQVGDHLLSPTGEIARVQSKNTAVTPHQITIRPIDSTVDLAGDFVANGLYAIVSNSYGEDSDIPFGRVPRITKYTNTFQIVKAGGGATGTEASNSLFVRFEQGGDSIVAVMNKVAWREIERNISLTLLMGEQINNITAVANTSGIDVPVLGTEGLVPWATASGHTHTYNPAAYTLADFDNVSRVLWQERAGVSRVMTLDGFDVFTATENLLLSESGTDLTAYIMKNMASAYQGVSAEDMQPFETDDFGLYVGFKALKKSGITYMFKQLHEFSEENGLGNAVYDYTQYRIVLPTGETRDARTGRKGFMWGLEYKAKDGYSREMQFGQFGGIGTTGAFTALNGPVNGFDSIRWGMLSEFAGHFACPNKVVLQIPT